MRRYKKTAALLLGFILLCAAAGFGCSGAKNAFTLEDLENANTADAIFKIHTSVRKVSHYYDIEFPGVDRGDHTQTTVYLKEGDTVCLYTAFSTGAAYAIEGRNVYSKSPDGACEVIAFFDDGFFDTYYLPYVTQWITYAPTEGKEIISASVSGGIRKLTTSNRASDEEDFAMLGIPDGTMESHYELDAKSGLLLSEVNYLITDDGDRRMLSQTEVQYDVDGAFLAPDYVNACKDMTETRTLHFVREPNTPEEKIFTFTLPRGVALYPYTMEAYEYFADAACTLAYEWNAETYPDEGTVYMKN